MNLIAIYFALIFLQCIAIINGDTDNIVVTPEEYEGVKNSLDFRGKVVLVTGSTSGIGAMTARLYCYLGATVVITGRNKTRLDEVVNDCYKLSNYKMKPLGLQLDFSFTGNIAKLVNATVSAFKKIDIVVHCAGMAQFATIEDPTFNDVYAETRVVNEEAGVELVRLTVPYVQQTNGSIILIASILGRNPISATSAYSMAKNALVALTKSVAFDVGPNVKINAISPGIVDGTRIFRLLPSDVRPALIASAVASSPLKRAGVPMDIAKIVIFLTSDLCTYFDGSNFFADGGINIKLI